MRNVEDQVSRPRGRPRRTPQERAERREDLIQGAIAAVRASGADVSIDDLATAIGVSKPVLYGEFGDKNGIADAIAIYLAERLERTVVASIPLEEGMDILGAARAFIEGVVDVLVDDPEVYAFVVRAIRVSDRGFLDNALVRALHSRARVVMVVLAPEAPTETVNRLVDGLYGFVFATVESWKVARTPARAELVDALVKVIEAGIGVMAEDGSPQPAAG